MPPAAAWERRHVGGSWCCNHSCAISTVCALCVGWGEGGLLREWIQRTRGECSGNLQMAVIAGAAQCGCGRPVESSVHPRHTIVYNVHFRLFVVNRIVVSRKEPITCHTQCEDLGSSVTWVMATSVDLCASQVIVQWTQQTRTELIRNAMASCGEEHLKKSHIGTTWMHCVSWISWRIRWWFATSSAQLQVSLKHLPCEVIYNPGRWQHEKL